MSNIWFTSDTHYNHKNIVKGTTSWTLDGKDGGSHSLQSTRDFNTLEEHNETLVNNINSLVKEDDILYHLGDWSFGGINSIWNFRKQLKCKNIHLIFGNHDHHIENHTNIPTEQIGEFNKLNVFSSWHGVDVGSAHLNCLFKSVQHYKEIVINKQIFCLSHYSHRVWNKSHKGSIHLYGHSHGTLPGLGKSMDVGVDTNNLKPYHTDEIMERMNKVETKIVDHHTKYTN